MSPERTYVTVATPPEARAEGARVFDVVEYTKLPIGFFVVKVIDGGYTLKLELRRPLSKVLKVGVMFIKLYGKFALMSKTTGVDLDVRLVT